MLGGCEVSTSCSILSFPSFSQCFVQYQAREEMNIVPNIVDKCKHLRRLRNHLIEELRVLKEDVQEEQTESFDNPIVMVNMIKSLQEALNTVNHELEKCPDED